MLFELIAIDSIAKINGHICKSYVHSGDNFAPREIYINTIKASSQVHWRKHKNAHLSIQVISGSASFLFATDPTGSATTSIDLDESSLFRLLIFPHSWFSIISTSSSDLVLLCISDILHDPNEIVTL